MFTQVYAVALLAIFARSALAATCSRTYTIKQGDFCDKISEAQNVSTYQLAALNPSLINKGCTNLTPGESICLGFTGEDCSTTHVVQSGDTCADIAANNGFNMTILQLNNPQLNQACNIYVGEVLCTAQTVQVPAIPASGVTVSMGGKTAISTIVPLRTSVLSAPAAVATPTPAPKDTSTPAPQPQPTDDGGNEDDLPFCDEL
jgi:LysM repeat protein